METKIIMTGVIKFLILLPDLFFFSLDVGTLVVSTPRKSINAGSLVVLKYLVTIVCSADDDANDNEDDDNGSWMEETCSVSAKESAGPALACAKNNTLLGDTDLSG